jgi:hypothetical protein
MNNRPSVILSGFADEAANQKTAVQQFAALAAMGLQYYTIRFIDVGNGVKNVMQLLKQEIAHIRHLEDEYGLNVSSLGSPIGKVKLLDVDDGTKNRYVPFKKYLTTEVKKACELAHAFETNIRGFSFYARDSDPRTSQWSINWLRLRKCHRSDLVGWKWRPTWWAKWPDQPIHRHGSSRLGVSSAEYRDARMRRGRVYEQYLAMKRFGLDASGLSSQAGDKQSHVDGEPAFLLADVATAATLGS